MQRQLSEWELRRFARQIVLPEVGGVGQARLRASTVAVIGAGGLGSPLALYLAAAGVGRLVVVDHDRVDETNLHRQILFAEQDLGRPKAEAAKTRLEALGSGVEVVAVAERLDDTNATRLLACADVVADGSDNFPTRLAVQRACLELRRPLVSAAVQGMDGQLTTFLAHLGPPHPCLACLFPESPAAGALPSCAQGGVLGPAAGVMGTLQAVEVMRLLLGQEAELSGVLLLYDARRAGFTRLRFARRPDCRLCAALPRVDGPVAPLSRLD